VVLQLAVLFPRFSNIVHVLNFCPTFMPDQRQFGFKKDTGSGSAIYTARQIVSYFIEGNCAACLCALDISKTLDKVNHHALFIELMERRVPKMFLSLLINWLPFCQTCIKWDGLVSDFSD
jgi:hypothetical protein